MKRIKRATPWTVAAMLIAASLPLALHGACSAVRFNQFMVQAAHARHGVISAGDAARSLRSAWLSGANILWNRPSSTTPDFDDRRAMLSHIFAWVPADAVVYPTEGFYYFTTSDARGPIWGNLRVADLDAGRLTMAYFRPETHETRFLDVGGSDGLGVVRLDDHCYDVSWNGRTVRFRVWERESAMPSKLALEADEQFAGRVLDESGIVFLLVFNRTTSAFYYLLDEESGVADALDDVGDGLLHGRRTQFVYRTVGDRKLLVGVAYESVRANNFFDGPADQVPYRASLREMLNAAYPSTKLGDGIDEHGVFLNRPEWLRYAISPFHRYLSIPELKSYLANARPEGGIGAQCTRLTREWWNTRDYLARTADKLESEGKHDAAMAARRQVR